MKVVDGQLVDVLFQIHMGPAAVAACNMKTRLVVGKSVNGAYGFTGEEVVAAFNRLCGNFADLLHARERTAEHAIREVVG